MSSPWRVTARAVDMFRKVAGDNDLPLSRLVEGTVVPLAELENPRDGCDWDDYALLCDRLQAALGEGGMRNAGRGFLEIPKVGSFARIGATFASPRMFYWSGSKFSPNMFGAVSATFKVLGPTEVEIAIAIKPDARDSSAFFHFNAGVFMAMPRMIGMPESVVDMTLTPRKAVYRIIHPPALSIWGRIKHVFIALTSVQGAYDELEAQNRELLERLEEVRRARALADAASTMKSRFMANISHEIRTPLNGILGMAELAQESSHEAETIAALETIRSSAVSMLAVINDVLDFSRLEAGRLRLEAKDWDVRQVLTEHARIFETSARAKNLRINVEIAAAVPEVISSDENRIRQVINNLMSNAIKFTERGFVTLRVDMDASTTPALRVLVEDSGIGIEPAWRERLFNPFVQVDDSLTRTAGGSGLGLAICKQLVELMGGRIDFSSEPGNGTRFWFTMPFQVVEQTNSKAPLALIETSTAEPAPRGPSIESKPSAPVLALAPPVLKADSPRFLVVEDNLVNQKVLVGMLKRLGHATDVATNGQEAVDLAALNDYALIFMDCQMPVMDGFQATREIRSSLPGRKQPRIIAITAHVMDGYKEQCLSAGMDDYLSKPVGRRDLEDTIARHLAVAQGGGARPSATA